jgi:hypothetical protein
MRPSKLLFPTVLLLAACASAPRWTKDGATKADEARAEDACKREADMATPDNEAGVARMQTLMEICMDAHGWSEAR